MTLLSLITIIYVFIFIFDYRRVRSANDPTQKAVYLTVLTAAYLITAGYCLLLSTPTLPGF